MDTKEAGKRGGQSRSEKKQSAARANVAKARASRAKHGTVRPAQTGGPLLLVPAKEQQ